MKTLVGQAVQLIERSANPLPPAGLHGGGRSGQEAAKVPLLWRHRLTTDLSVPMSGEAILRRQR